MAKHKPTVWAALNEPIVHVSEDQAEKIILAAVVIMAAAWIAPYWNRVSNTVYYAPTNVFEQMATLDQGDDFGIVAGAQTTFDQALTPEWYIVAHEMPTAVMESFAASANEVLDISSQVQAVTDFYQPGLDAVTDAWLNLMRDPGTPEF